MIELVFWLSCLSLVYAYGGFAALLFVRARLWRRPFAQADILPRVSVLVVAHNEAFGIRRKLENFLMLDYPSNLFDVIVASDGSDDGTNEIVATYEGRGRIQLVALPRRGKIPTLNEAVAYATGEILVLSDANSIYSVDAFRALVRPFADPTVGAVAGSQCYLKDTVSGSTGAAEHAYWNYDQLLKRWQSEAGSVTSATGAIYAIRRELFEPIPGGVCDDAMVSYRVIARGYRVVFEPAAVAYEPVAGSAKAEFRRKVRVCARGLRGIVVERRLFNPFRFGFYSIQLFSHKLLRWIVVWPLAALFLTSLWLSSAGTFYKMAAAGQLAFYALALVGFWLRRNSRACAPLPKVFSLPFYFCLANAASFVAQIQVLRGKRIDSWEVRRQQSFEVTRRTVGTMPLG